MAPIGSQRRIVIAAVLALTIGITASATSGARAADPLVARLEVAATALRPALRLAQSGSINFPINPLPRCEMNTSSFGQPRSGGRTHEGLDIMANKGQEIYAVGNGKLIKQTVDGATDATLSGNSWKLQLPDGTYYFYAHLSAFADGLKVNDSVVLGQLIGYVGDTGNPGAGNYHLHFEVHPKGGAAVDPFPMLTIPKSCRIYTA